MATTAIADRSRSEWKREAILDAARDLFLAGGYLGTNMDEVAMRAKVSKQTVYQHFGTKEALFVEIVTTMTSAASATVHRHDSAEFAGGDVEAFLVAYAERQLRTVMVPSLMQLRRLVIGEVTRFPQLAASLREHGPEHAVKALTRTIERLADEGLLEVQGARTAAEHLNWLVMGQPVNDAMLLGDEAIPSTAALRRHAKAAVKAFLAAYGARP